MGRHRGHFAQRVQPPIVHDLKPQILDGGLGGDPGGHVLNEQGGAVAGLVGEAGGLDLDEGVFAVGATRLPDGGLARRIAAAIEGLGRLGGGDVVQIKAFKQGVDAQGRIVQNGAEQLLSRRIMVADTAGPIDGHDRHRRADKDAARQRIFQQLSSSFDAGPLLDGRVLVTIENRCLASLCNGLRPWSMIGLLMRIRRRLIDVCGLWSDGIFRSARA